MTVTQMEAEVQSSLKVVQDERNRIAQQTDEQRSDRERFNREKMEIEQDKEVVQREKERLEQLLLKVRQRSAEIEDIAEVSALIQCS